MDEPMNGRRLHFIAIGGAGMSGLALVARTLGAEVTGSDRAESSYLERLRAAGIEPQLGHDAAHVPPDAEVVVSTAVPEDNPELVRARERGQRVIHRGELLAELCARAPAAGHRRDPRQDHDDRDVHLGAPRDRRRPGLLPRRRAAGRRIRRRARERRLGGGRVGGRRGRRERRQLPQASSRDRGDHQPRARSPLPLELARGALGGLRRLRGACGRPSLRRRRALAGARRHSVSSVSPWSPAAVGRRRTPS